MQVSDSPTQFVYSEPPTDTSTRVLGREAFSSAMACLTMAGVFLLALWVEVEVVVVVVWRGVTAGCSECRVVVCS